MKTNNIALIFSQDGEDFAEFKVWYHPARITRAETGESPAEWSDPILDSVENSEGKTLTDSEIDAFGLTVNDWTEKTEITLTKTDN